MIKSSKCQTIPILFGDIPCFAEHSLFFLYNYLLNKITVSGSLNICFFAEERLPLLPIDR
jgi:hypothetical protein